MDGDGKKLLKKLEDNINLTFLEFLETRCKLTRLFRAYNKNSNLYSTINRIATEIYPNDIRIFLNIYQNLDNDDSKNQKQISNNLDVATKIYLKSTNQLLLESYSEELESLREDNLALKNFLEKLYKSQPDHYLNHL